MLPQHGVVSRWSRHTLLADRGILLPGRPPPFFFWHCDCEDVDLDGLPSDVVTAVVQCSDGATGMRLLGHDILIYSRGRVANPKGTAVNL